MPRRSPVLLPVVLLGAGALLLRFYFDPHQQPFVNTSVRSPLRDRVAARGLAEDIDEWKATLTPEERDLVDRQAAGEYDKAFRKSEDFKKDIPDDKVSSFGRVLQKFMEAEWKDVKEDDERKRKDMPNTDELLAAKGDRMDWSLKGRVVEVDREAMRRYKAAALACFQAKADNASPEDCPAPASRRRVWMDLPNNSTEDHESIENTLEIMKGLVASGKLGEEETKVLKYFTDKPTPPIGTPLTILVTESVAEVMLWWSDKLKGQLAALHGQEDKGEFNKFVDKGNQAGFLQLYIWGMKRIMEKHLKAADHVDEVVAKQKALFASRLPNHAKLSKGDVFKALWKTLKEDPNWPELGDIPQDLVDDLSKEPAPNPDNEPAMNWATAEKLYKSEAIDAFGVKYILGIFESPIDAIKAFKDWSAEYEKARAGVKKDLAQKSQEANAKLQANKNIPKLFDMLNAEVKKKEDRMAAKSQDPRDGPQR